MAEERKKVSQLEKISEATGKETFHVVQNGKDKQASFDDLKGFIGTGGEEIQADEEDLTLSGSKLKFKDRAWDNNGMGYVILRKDDSFKEQVEGKSNTIFEIRYDFDLKGGNVNIKENCVLKFNGGSISNGNLYGNKTKILNSNVKCFEKDLGLYQFSEVNAAWLGILPDKDCTEELEHFSQFGLSIRFDEGSYNFTIANLLLSYGTELIGTTDKLGTVFNLTPKAGYDYLIGLSYKCSLYNIHIYHSNVGGIAKGDIIRISNKFARPGTADEDSQGSDYNYRIDNVQVNGTWREDDEYEDGITALKIETNSEGNTTNSYSLSWMNRVSDFRVKFAKVGIHIQSISGTSSAYWQNTLYFHKLCINAKYGIWFDREGGHSHGHCMISDYLFQSTNKNNSFGLYGVGFEDNVSNYYSWDNIYLGMMTGSIYMNNTALAINIMSASITPPEGYNYQEGFLVKEGKSLRVNVTRKSINNYLPNDYNPQSGTYVIEDFSERYKKKYVPNNGFPNNYREEVFIPGEARAETNMVLTGVKYMRDIYGLNSGGGAYKAVIGRNQSEGRTYLLAKCTIPKLQGSYGVNDFVNNYNGKTTWFYLKNPSTSIFTNCYLKITITYDSTDTKFSASGLYLESIASMVGEVQDVSVNGKTIICVLKVNNTTTQWGFKVAATVKFLAFTSDTTTETMAENITGSASVEFIGAFKGSSSNRPTGVEDGFEYYDTTLGKTIYWNASSQRWVNSDGFAAGVRSGASFIREQLGKTLSGLDSGLQFFDVQLAKVVVWDGNYKWVNVDGSALEEITE